jgi:hypothetical protein
MAHQIIKQPDGKWSIFSSITDGFIALDMTQEELIKWEGDVARIRAETEARRILDEIERGENPYRRRYDHNRDDEFGKQLRKLQRIKT